MPTAQELKDYVDNNLPSNNRTKMNLLRSVIKYLIDEIVGMIGAGSGVSTVSDTVIELGQIGTDSIDFYINNNDAPEWNMRIDHAYTWTCVRNGLLEVYAYIGTKPKYLGQSQQTANIADFKLLYKGLSYIEDCFVRKANLNPDLTKIEENDKVYHKSIPNNGDPIILMGHTYKGPDRDVETSYLQETSYSI